jgi:FAD/FMN-containing dehydrogenase
LLKPVGNGHDFGNLMTCVNNEATDRDSYILNLTNLKHLEVFDNHTVVFGGGWDLIDLIPGLQEHRLQVANLGSEMVQNYIGAATTSTHGTGKQHQNLSNKMIGLRVLDATGEIHVITEEATPELLTAFRIGLGVLGIIVEVTLQAEPLTFLKRITKVVEVPRRFNRDV